MKLTAITEVTKVKKRNAKAGSACSPVVLSRTFRTPAPKHASQRHQNKQPDDGNHHDHNQHLRVEILTTNDERSGNIALCSGERQHSLCSRARTAQQPSNPSTDK